MKTDLSRLLTRRALRRAPLVAGCLCAWLLILTPAASALGLPFVDLPSAGGMVDDASQALVKMIAGAVGTLTNEIIKVSDTVGAPQVGSANSWFTASYKRTVEVSLWLMAIAAMIAVTSAGIRGKVGEMVGVILVNVPGAVIAMMLATVGVQLSLGLVDAMTAYTFGGSIPEIQTFLHNMGTTFASYDGASGAAASTLAPGLALIIGLLVIVAQIVILAVLVIRSALVYIVTLFLPLVFAIQVWPSCRHMTRKSLELLAVIVLSKFAIFTCFALGAGAATDVLKVHAGAHPPAVQSAIIGFGVMAAAAFSPLLLLSIIPGIAGSFGAPMPGGSAQSGAVRTPAQVMRGTLATIHTVRSGGSGSGSGGGGGGRGASMGGRQSASRMPAPPAASRGGSAAAAAAGPGSTGAAVPALAAATQETAHNSPVLHPPVSASPVAGAVPGPQPVEVGAGGSVAPSTDRHTQSSVAAAGGFEAPASSRQLTAPMPAAVQTNSGFASVSTNQQFTLETT